MGQKFEKKSENCRTVSKTVAQCRKYPIPYLYRLSRTIPYLYTLNRTIPYLYTLNRTIPYPNILSRTIPYLNTLSRTIPYLNTSSRTIPYLNTLSRTIHYLYTLRKNQNLAQNQILVGSQSKSSTKNPKTSSANQNRVSQCRKNPNALGLGGGPFSALGFSRLAIAYLIT